MNTYNDNLHSLVFTSVQNREQQQKKLIAQLNAAKISLYYAQGESIGAKEKLELAKEDLKLKRKIKNQAVNNSNLGNNIQTSAEQQKNYSDQAMSNMATCATNVQIASQAILKLAGSVGSIYSIVNAADYGADVYNNVSKVKKLMEKTAYEAERSSELAMDAAAQSAEIPVNKMESQAKLTDASLKQVLQVANAEYDQIAAEVTTDNNTLASDKNLEKLAQGKLEDINVDQMAAAEAYQFLNKELNLNLKVEVEIPDLKHDAISGLSLPLEQAYSPKEFNVSFSSILSPFQAKEDPSVYPISKYYVILVKNSKRGTFSIEDAESIIAEKPPKGKSYYLPVSVPNDYETKEGGSIPLNVVADCSSICDSDKDKFEYGENYVAFVFAEYDNAYKKAINDFENYLSAPSATFNLTNLLASPSADSIKVEQDKLEFTTEKNTNASFSVKYRCMFLPVSSDSTSLSDLTQKSLKLNTYSKEYEMEVDHSAKQLEAIEERLKSAEDELNAALKQAKEGLNQRHTEQRIKRIKLKKRLSVKDKKDLRELEEHLKEVISWNDRVENAQKTYDRLNSVSKKINEKLEGLTQDQLSFYFDQDLAEHVSEANYYEAELLSKKSDKKQEWEVELNDTTTDNFGIPLIKGEKYLPVVLTVSDAEEDKLHQFSSSLSNYEETAVFTFHPITNA